MQTVVIKEKRMVIDFPDEMTPEEIERAIYTHVYNQPVMSQGKELSRLEKANLRLVQDLASVIYPKDPKNIRVGPLTPEDFEAFEPAEVQDVETPRPPETQDVVEPSNYVRAPMPPRTQRMPEEDLTETDFQQGGVDTTAGPEPVVSPAILKMQAGQAESARNVARHLRGMGRGLKAMGHGLLRGTQSFWQFFDDAATLVSGATGLEKGGVFQALAEMAEPPANWTPQDLAERVVSGIVAAGPEIGLIASGARYLPGGAVTSMAGIGAVRGGAEGGPSRAAYEATKGALLALTLKGASLLPKPYHAPTVGGVFAGQAAVEGGTAEEVAEAGAVGVGLGLFGGRERKRPIVSKETFQAFQMDQYLKNAESKIAEHLKRGEIKEADLVYVKTVTDFNLQTEINDVAFNAIQQFERSAAVQQLKAATEPKPKEPPIETPREPQKTPPEPPIETPPEPAAVPKGKKVFKPRKPPSAENARTFVGWINAMGGLWDPTLPGEIKQFTAKEARIVGLIRKKTGNPIDIMTRYAVEAGWLPEGATDSDFIELLRKDMFALKGKGQRVQKIQDIGESIEKDPLLKKAEEEQRTWAEGIDQDAAEAEKKGFDYYGPGHEEVVEDLKPGDKLLRNGEEYTCLRYDTDGRMIIQNDQTFKLDRSDTIGAEAIKKKPEIRTHDAWHTTFPDRKPADFDFIQRSAGTYVALDKPWHQPGGKISKVWINYDLNKIFDPNGVLEGTPQKQSIEDFELLTAEMNRRAKTISEYTPRKMAELRRDILKDLGYEGEAGWIDGPERGERELVLFNKAAIKKSPDFKLTPTTEKAPQKVQRTPEEIERDQLEAQGQTKIEMPESKTWQPYGVGSLKEKTYPQKEALALLESLREKHGDAVEFRMVETAAADEYRIEQRPKVMLAKVKAKMKEGPIRGGDTQEDLFGKKEGALFEMEGPEEPPKEPPKGEGAAGTGGYAALVKEVMDMPEIVEFAKQLAGGKYPVVRRRLAQALARGVFYPQGEGRIELRADIFKDPKKAAATIAHEIGHMDDWLPDKDLARGNIFGRIATLKKYMKHTLPRRPGAPGELTEKDRRRLRYLAKKLVEKENADKWIDEIIEKELPITSKDVLAIWNAVEQAKLLNPDLYDYIARLSTPEKKSIVKEALKGQVAAQLQRFAKIVREKTGKKVPAEITPDMIHKKYVDLINEEIRKRRLFNLNEVMDELKALAREWKPFDPAANPDYTKYRYSSPELYADAISVLMNQPGLLKAKAPLFYEAFFNYLERKPNVKELYEKIQDDIRSGKVQKDRVKRLRESFRQNDARYFEGYQRHGPRIRDLLAREFIDTDWMLLQKIWKIGERTIPAGDNPRYKMEDMRYSGSEAEWYTLQVAASVKKPLEKVNLTWDDFGETMFHGRVSTERAEMAAPQGWTERLSKERLAEMEKGFTPEQAEAMREATRNFVKNRESMVIDKLESAEIYSQEFIDRMRDNKNYATFDVGNYVSERYGRGPGAKIFRQYGTLQEITNPATATVMKDLSIIKSVNKQIAAKSVTDFFRKYLPNEITPADRRWNGKFWQIQDPKPSANQGLIVYLNKGKLEGFYVDKYIAESFERNPVESAVIAQVLRYTVRPFKMAFTELNYGFWMFNMWRDYFRAAKALPGASLTNFLKYYKQGIKPAFRSVYGIPDDVATEALKRKMLISVADLKGLRPEDAQIERLLSIHGMKPPSFRSKWIRPFGQMFYYYTNIGRGFERATKIAGMQYLNEKFPDLPPEVKAHIVRGRAGSPDFLRFGRGYPIYNNLLLYSNANKEGWRSDYEAFSERPAEFLWKQAKYTYIPKLLMKAAEIGLLGAGAAAIIDGASEYDKTNYVVIPLGLTETGKSVYIRMPLDETGRLMGGVLWKLLSRDTKQMTTGLFDYMAGQAPTIHPGVEMLAATVQYAAGLNPYDHFKGRYAIPEQMFLARDERTHKAFLKWLANKSGATLVYRFRSDDVDAIKSELEDVLYWPFASNLVGRFVKVSNQGIREHLREMKFDIRQSRAREILDAKDVLLKWTRGEPIDQADIDAVLKAPDLVDRNMMVNLARKYGMVYLEEYMTATTAEEKAAVWVELLKKQQAGEEGGGWLKKGGKR